MNKAVFFDIDGTLMNQRMEIREDTLEAIRALREKGIKTAIATGRAGIEFETFRRQFGRQIEGLFDLYVYANGGIAVYQGREILRKPLPPEEVDGMVQICTREGIVHGVFDDHTVRMNVESFPGYERFFSGNLAATPHVCDPQYHKSHDIFAGFMVCGWDKAPLFQGFDHCVPVQGILPGGALGWHLDFWRKDVSKAWAIAQCMEPLGTDLAHTYTFGDGYNDIEMLELAGTCVAMGNAEDGVKAHADFVTAHIDEGGIAYGLRHLGLL